MLVQVTLLYDRETKNTYVFKAPEEAAANIDTLYIKKTAFQGEVPESINVMVEETE